jgi:hypothetical protein
VPHGATRTAGIPSMRCTAKTRRGTPCMNFCSVGRLTCRLHGGNAGQVVRKADERVTLAQLLQSDPRPIPVVLMEAVHNVDAVARDMRAGIEEGEAVSLDQLDRFLSVNRVTAHLAKTVVETGVLAKLVAEQRVAVEEIGVFISEVLLAVLNALPLTVEWRDHLLDVADYKLLEIGRTQGARVLDVPDGPPPERPLPPPLPILRADPAAASG